MEYLLIFIAGVMGSFHCIGMCGAFPLALSAAKKSTTLSVYISHMLYNSGRIVTYVSLGSLFGLFGYVVGETNFIINGQVVVSLIAGIFMMFVGLQIAGIFRETTIPGFGYIYRYVSRAMSYFIKKGDISGGFYLGLFNGFLPCPLVYAFLFTSAATSSPVKGALVMAMLGLGTVPAMLLLGIMSEFLSPSLRGNLARYVPGLIVFVFGIVTIARAFIPFFPDAAHLMHH